MGGRENKKTPVQRFRPSEPSALQKGPLKKGPLQKGSLQKGPLKKDSLKDDSLENGLLKNNLLKNDLLKNNASLNNPLNEPPLEDIPEAQRDSGSGQGKGFGSSAVKRFFPLWLLGLVVFGAIALGLGLGVIWGTQRNRISAPNINANPAVSGPAVSGPAVSGSGGTRKTSGSDLASEVESGVASDLASDNGILGHLAYTEAKPETLRPIVPDGSLQLREAAANAFLDMQAAAQADGVSLVPLSGFRSQADQTSLFFDVKAERGQNTQERATVSAPPGYSEHHTGYAVDIGDGQAPETNLRPTFEETETFRWLENNAATFQFELSFPRDNLHGISYEPWHWRFVGDRHSLETFYKARQLRSSKSNPRP